MSRRLRVLSLLIFLMPGLAGASSPVTVFAAASLKEALNDLAISWARSGQPGLRVSLGSSGALAKQIAQGAPAGIFISADEKWMDYLQQRHLIEPATRSDLLTNSLVLIAPASTAPAIILSPGFNLAALLGQDGRLAIGGSSVPAGIYARQALNRLHVWNQVKDHLAPTEDVRGALLLVETGEAPAGIVYATDARGDAKVTVIGRFPASSHDPITYPIALVTPQPDPAASHAVLDFLHGPKARAVFARAGFGTK